MIFLVGTFLRLPAPFFATIVFFLLRRNNSIDIDELTNNLIFRG